MAWRSRSSAGGRAFSMCVPMECWCTRSTRPGGFRRMGRSTGCWTHVEPQPFEPHDRSPDRVRLERRSADVAARDVAARRVPRTIASQRRAVVGRIHLTRFTFGPVAELRGREVCPSPFGLGVAIAESDPCLLGPDEQACQYIVGRAVRDAGQREVAELAGVPCRGPGRGSGAREKLPTVETEGEALSTRRRTRRGFDPCRPRRGRRTGRRRGSR